MMREQHGPSLTCRFPNKWWCRSQMTFTEKLRNQIRPAEFKQLRSFKFTLDFGRSRASKLSPKTTVIFSVPSCEDENKNSWLFPGNSSQSICRLLDAHQVILKVCVWEGGYRGMQKSVLGLLRCVFTVNATPLLRPTFSTIYFISGVLRQHYLSVLSS